jgi:hypothetical protein
VFGRIGIINVTLSRLFASSIKLLIVLLILFIAVRKIGVDISPLSPSSMQKPSVSV